MPVLGRDRRFGRTLAVALYLPWYAYDSERRTPDSEGLVADLAAVEEETVSLARLHPGLRLTVVRPAALVGPGVDTMITRHFEAPRLLTLRGTSPAWTFCHAEDLGSALVTVVHEPVPDEVGP